MSCCICNPEMNSQAYAMFDKETCDGCGELMPVKEVEE